MLKIVQHVSNYVISSSGTQIVYYTSYIRMVLIKIYKLGRQNVVNCVEFVVITPAIADVINS